MTAMCGKLRFELNAKKWKISECLGWEGVYRGMWWRDAPEVTARMAMTLPVAGCSCAPPLRSCVTDVFTPWLMRISELKQYVLTLVYTAYSKQYYSIRLWAYLLSEYQLLHISTPEIEAISKSLHLAYSFFVTHFFNAKFDKSCNNGPVYQNLMDWFF